MATRVRCQLSETEAPSNLIRNLSIHLLTQGPDESRSPGSINPTGVFLGDRQQVILLRYRTSRIVGHPTGGNRPVNTVTPNL